MTVTVTYKGERIGKPIKFTNMENLKQFIEDQIRQGHTIRINPN